MQNSYNFIYHTMVKKFWVRIIIIILIILFAQIISSKIECFLLVRHPTRLKLHRVRQQLELAAKFMKYPYPSVVKIFRLKIPVSILIWISSYRQFGLQAAARLVLVLSVLAPVSAAIHDTSTG